MKKYIVTTLVLVAVLVPPAMAVNNSLASRVRTLERKVTALTGQTATMRQQLATLTTQGTDLAAFVQCIRSVPVVPMTRFGQPSQGNGYLYGYNDRPDIYLASALDVPDAGDPVHVRVAAVSPQCVTTASSSARAGATGKTERRVGKLSGESWRKALP